MVEVLKKASGIIVPGLDQRTMAGRNADGSYFIEIRGKQTARAHFTPRQMFELCTSLLGQMGYGLERVEPPTL